MIKKKKKIESLLNPAQIQQLLMHFISNPNSFNKLVDNISNTIDNMADKLDPAKILAGKKPYNIKKGYTIMNLILKYLDLIKIMQSKFDENLREKISNTCLDIESDGIFFNSHLQKLWSMIKLILCELSALKIDGITSSLSEYRDIKFESPQLFIQNQRNYSTGLEKIGFKTDSCCCVDKSKIRYPEDIKNIFKDKINPLQNGLLLSIRDEVKSKYEFFINGQCLQSLATNDQQIKDQWLSLYSLLGNDSNISFEQLFEIFSEIENFRYNVSSGIDVDNDGDSTFNYSDLNSTIVSQTSELDNFLSKITAVGSDKSKIVKFKDILENLVKIERILYRIYSQDFKYIENETFYIGGFDYVEDYQKISEFCGTLYLIDSIDFSNDNILLQTIKNTLSLIVNRVQNKIKTDSSLDSNINVNIDEIKRNIKHNKDNCLVKEVNYPDVFELIYPDILIDGVLPGDKFNKVVEIVRTKYNKIISGYSGKTVDDFIDEILLTANKAIFSL